MELIANIFYLTIWAYDGFHLTPDFMTMPLGFYITMTFAQMVCFFSAGHYAANITSLKDKQGKPVGIFIKGHQVLHWIILAIIIIISLTWKV